MNMSKNLFPCGQWIAMIVTLQGKETGSCIHLTLADENSCADFSFHYGKEENREAFVKMFKDAVSKLP